MTAIDVNSLEHHEAASLLAEVTNDARVSTSVLKGALLSALDDIQRVGSLTPERSEPPMLGAVMPNVGDPYVTLHQHEDTTSRLEFVHTWPAGGIGADGLRSCDRVLSEFPGVALQCGSLGSPSYDRRLLANRAEAVAAKSGKRLTLLHRVEPERRTEYTPAEYCDDLLRLADEIDAVAPNVDLGACFGGYEIAARIGPFMPAVDRVKIVGLDPYALVKSQSIQGQERDIGYLHTLCLAKGKRLTFGEAGSVRGFGQAGRICTLFGWAWKYRVLHLPYYVGIGPLGDCQVEPENRLIFTQKAEWLKTAA